MKSTRASRAGWRLALALALGCVGPLAAAAADPVAITELLRNARHWQALGQADKLRFVLNKILAVDAAQPQALLMLAELELRDGRTSEAQRLLARLQAGAGDSPASAELQDLVRVYTRDLPRLQQLRLLRRGGNDARAAVLARELFPGGRAPGSLELEFAALLGRPGVRPPTQTAAARPPAAAARPALRPVTPSVTTPPRLPDPYWPLLREAEALRDAGRLDDALQKAEAALQGPAAETEGRLLQAELLARLGRTDRAELLYRLWLASDPAPAVRERVARRLVALLQGMSRQEAALAVAAQQQAPAAIDIGSLRQAADAEVAADRPGGALRLLEAALAQRPREPWLRHDLARRYAALGQAGLAQAVLAEGLALAPADAEMHYAAALAYAAMDRDDAALAVLQAVPEVARDDKQQALAQRLRDARALAAARRSAEQAAVERRRVERLAWRQPTDEVALFPYARRARDGLTSLQGLELPIVLTRPDPVADGADESADAGPERKPGHRWLHIDPVRINAGTLPAAFDEAADFGTVLASGQPLAAPLLQRARGLNLGVGWTGESRRWDIGIVGAGFELPNLVGGWREAITLAGHDASVELSRRVLTGGLLPYAGTRDPVSGRRWGGVTMNALTLRSGGDWAGWSTSASLRAGWLTGRKVANNDTLQLRLAADRDWISSPAMTLNAGATLSLWRYRRNLSSHSFGHGGYYSPQRYLSLSLPLQAQGRFGAWSYRLRAAVGRSWTFEADAPYYPGDTALQAAAGQPLHRGGRGGGTSSSLRAEVERRFSPHWSAGATVNAERSAYYAPTQWLFYLRRNLAPQGGEMPLPRPLLPYSQF